MENTMTIQWTDSIDDIDWAELSELYRLAPLGNKSPEWLRTAFSNSMFKCLGYDAGKIVAAGRAVADGVDCSYLCDIAIHPAYQGAGLGKTVIQRLIGQSRGHRKIILYAVPGKETFYGKFGFRRMLTAMAMFENPEEAASNGYIEEG
jgi:ribosomal protein S18 acetylase RimI-like enzyme